MGEKANLFIGGILKADIFKARFFRPEFIRKTDKYLIIISVVLFAYILADIIMVSPYKSIKNRIAGSAYSGKYDYHAVSAGQDEKDYSAYSSLLSGRQFFGRDTVSVKETVSEEPPVNISLVGIIPGTRPQAIIEDKNTQEVYYVYEGDKFGNFIVDKVDDSKAVIDYQGKKIELSL